MNCPNCGAPEKARVKVCPECNQAYASQDLLELRQLEFLIDATDAWQVPDSLRSPYLARLEELRANLRIRPQKEEVVEEAKPAITPPPAIPYVVRKGKTNIYSGPGTHYPSLGLVSPGRDFKLIGISPSKDWWAIKIPTTAAPDGRGWIQTSEVKAFNAQNIPVIQAPPAPTEIAPEPVVTFPKPAKPTPPVPTEVAPKPTVVEPKPAPPAPPKEKVPFDQWLLSERNIKIALYSGGLLLLIAGIIFIGVNWTRIPGWGKFAITLMVTGLMYLGGYLLFQRPAYRIGGVALLGIAAGFFVLNFAVLQNYVLGPGGMSDEVMWLIASPFCLLLYMLTAYWTKSDLFTYLSLAALGSITAAGLVIAGATELVFWLAFTLLLLVLLLLAHAIINSHLSSFTYQPLMIVTHILAPLTFLGSLFILILGTGFTSLSTGNLWLILPILGVGTVFYILNAYWYQNALSTYVSLVTLGITMTAVLVLARAPELVFLVTYALYSLLMLFLAHGLKTSSLAGFTYQPLMIVAHIMMPLTYLATFIFVFLPTGPGNPWLTLPILALGTAFYFLSANWNRNQAFMVTALVTLGGIVFALLFLLKTPILAYPLVYSIFAYTCLILGRVLQDTSLKDFTRLPLLLTSQAVTPVLAVLAVIGSLTNELIGENPWLAVTTLGVATLFYITTDRLFKRLEARWAATILFPITFGISLIKLNFSISNIGIAFMVLALVYLVLGYFLEHREKRKAGGWPLYAIAYVMAALVTTLAIPNRNDLAIMLYADVLLLVISAAIHRSYWWVYGAVWSFMLPVYLTISLYITELHYQGLLIGVLGLNYVVAGYILGRRKLQLGGPFLTAATFLSVATVTLTWTDPLIATLVLSTAAALYLLITLWLGWSWLLLPALISVDLAVLTINIQLFGYQTPIERSLVLSYAILGVILTLGALILRSRSQDRWSWSLYLMGAIDLCGAYIVSLVLGEWLAVGVSSVMAILLLSFAWLERAFLGKQVKFPLLAYAGIGVLFVDHFFALEQILGRGVWENIWPAYTAGLCALFIALAWLLRQATVVKLYAIPLRRAGLMLMVIPLVGSVAIFVESLTTVLSPIIVAISFGIAGVTFTSDAVIRRIFRQVYFGLGAFMIMIWAVLLALEVSEVQAYILPIGLSLLGVGWCERSQGGSSSYKVLTYSGLILLMGSSFIQSIPRTAYGYAILLGVESLLALALGMRSHCRCYVQVGGFALIANAVVQLGPGFIDLPRWIQIGVTGAILLGGGLAALFRREQILTTRKRLANEWRQWNP